MSTTDSDTPRVLRARVAAMRLLKRAPEAREALRENKLTLTVAAQVQHFVRAVERTESRKVGVEETAQLVAEVAGKSKREVERMFVARGGLGGWPGSRWATKCRLEAGCPRGAGGVWASFCRLEEAAPLGPAAMGVGESVRPVSAEVSELRIGMDAELCELVAEAKVLAGTANHAEAINRALKKFVAERRRELTPKATQPTRPVASSTRPGPASRYIPRETLRALCQAHNLAAAREWGLLPAST